jgi:hypothetical protein
MKNHKGLNEVAIGKLWFLEQVTRGKGKAESVNVEQVLDPGCRDQKTRNPPTGHSDRTNEKRVRERRRYATEERDMTFRATDAGASKFNGQMHACDMNLRKGGQLRRGVTRAVDWSVDCTRENMGESLKRPGKRRERGLEFLNNQWTAGGAGAVQEKR